MLLYKAQSVRLYQAGAFGNKPRTWSSVDQLLAETTPGTKYALRYLGGGYTAFRRYNLTHDMLEHAIKEIVAAGGQRERIIGNEAMPDNNLTFQGEVMVDYRSWYVFGSKLKTQMVTALRSGVEYTGAAALACLRYAMDPPSFSQLEYLLDRYPGHVVEFSSYDHGVGELGFNTVFWDVRHS